MVLKMAPRVNVASLVVAFFLGARLTQALPAAALNARALNDASEIRKSYDYVVVGGGTAGLTIADRISESGEYSVLVIENGDFYDASKPGGDLRAARQYNITSLPQPGMNNRTVLVSMGHCVGGSSAINGMAVMRGTEQDYDTWAELGGKGSTWGWEGMLPYFKKAIHFVPPDPVFAEDYNVTYDIEAAWGQDEDTHVFASFPGGMNPGIKTFYQALKSVPGVKFPRDGHAGSQGVFWYPVSVDPETGRRSYSRTGHWDGLERDNYELLPNSRVEKIIIKEKVATGVQFVSKESRETFTVRAKKEVILSAGSIHSPHVLQLSGIGPRKLLEEAGIKVQVNLPGVGANFQDHPIGGGAIFRWGEEPATPETVSPANPGSEGQGQGLVAFLDLPTAAPETYRDIADRYESRDLAEYVDPDTEKAVLAGYKAQQKIYAREMRRKRVTFLNYIIGGSPQGRPINLHITSRGTIKLNTTNPEAEPVVDYRALSNPTDVDLMIAYLNFFRRFFSSGDLEQYNATETQPGADAVEREELESYIRAQYSPQGWHPVGTSAKMRREIGGVVDEELRVYGVKGLRVVDASIIPTLIGGTTQLTVYAIAEKAADLIKETWSVGEDESIEKEND